MGVGRVAPGVALGGINFHPDESVAQFVAQGLEALGGNQLIAGKAQANDAGPGVDALFDRG